MRTLVRLISANRDYRLLMSAGLVSMTGDWVLHVGLTFLVYSITGSTLASGATLLSSFLPSILLGSVAGVLVDRWDRRTTMVVANLLQATGLIPLLFVHGSGTIGIVYLVAAYQGCVEQFFAPAEQALVPHLVAPADLLSANGVNSQVQNAARLVGSGAGGVVAGLAGLPGLALIDGASFVVSAALLALIRYRAEGPDEAGHRNETGNRNEAGHRNETGNRNEDGHRAIGSFRRAVAEWRAGLHTCWSSQALRVVVVWGAISATGEGIMGTLFAPFVRDVLHGTGADYGLIVGIQAVGGVLGGVVVASAGARWSAYALFGWGSVAFGFVDLALFLYPLVLSGVFPAVLCMLAVGVPGAFAVAGMMTVFQRATPDEYRGRVYGARTVVYGISVLVGTGLASWLGEAIGIVPIIAIQGAGYVVAGCVVLLALRGDPAAGVHVEVDLGQRGTADMLADDLTPGAALVDDPVGGLP